MAAQEAAARERHRSPSIEENKEHQSSGIDVPLIKRHRRTEDNESSDSDIPPPIPKRRRLYRSGVSEVPAESSSSTEALASRQSNDIKSNDDDDKKIQKVRYDTTLRWT